MARGLEVRLQRLERIVGETDCPLTVVLLKEGETPSEVRAAHAATPGRILIVQFVASAAELEEGSQIEQDANVATFPGHSVR
jgi:hypothetical protein